jgi:hypothetical protein
MPAGEEGYCLATVIFPEGIAANAKGRKALLTEKSNLIPVC